MLSDRNSAALSCTDMFFIYFILLKLDRLKIHIAGLEKMFCATNTRQTEARSLAPVFPEMFQHQFYPEESTVVSKPTF